MNKNKYEVSKKYIHQIVQQYTCTTINYVHKYFYHPYVQQYTCTSDLHVCLNLLDRFAICNIFSQFTGTPNCTLHK